MRRKMICRVCALLCLLALAGCEREASMSATVGLTSGPLAEEDVREIFRLEGAYQVQKLTPWEGDYLAEVANPGGEDGWRGLYWVFGDTGYKVLLNRQIWDWEIGAYEITAPGVVEITTTGRNTEIPIVELKRSYTAVVAVDSQGRVRPDYEGAETQLWETTPHDGWQALNEPIPVNGEPVYDGGISGRYEQVYDVRLTVDGLSIAFVPSGESWERYGSFFPASTSVPNIDCFFDGESRTFTIRFYNTCLQSGGVTEAEQTEFYGPDCPYLGLYPYSFPAGDLGRGNHFIESASIVQDGEDAVVTMTLTGAAYAFEERSGNLGQDVIPYYTLSFREHDSGTDG